MPQCPEDPSFKRFPSSGDMVGHSGDRMTPDLTSRPDVVYIPSSILYFGSSNQESVPITPEESDSKTWEIITNILELVKATS